MRNKITSIITYIQHNNIDLALIQESWIRKCDGDKITEIKEYGYDVLTYRKPVKLEWGGGVAIIHRNDLKVNKVQSNIKFKTFEHVTCKVITESGPILLVCVYRRGYSLTNKFTVNQFIPEFSQLLDEIYDALTPIVFAGDINIHVELASPTDKQVSTTSLSSNISDVNKFLSLIDEYDLMNMIREPTHVSGGTLDLAIMSKSNPIAKKVEVGLQNEVCDSDHFHIKFEIPLKPIIKSNKITLRRRNLDNLKTPAFMESLLDLDLMNRVNYQNVNEATEAYHTALANLFDEACPQTEITVSSHKQQKWFNSELCEMKRACRKAERMYRKNPSSLHHNELINVRNLYKICIREARSSFFSNLFESMSDDIGLIYKTANYFVNDKKTRCLPSCTDDLTLANDFTQFFIDKINTIRADIENDSTVNIQLRTSLHTQFTGDGLSAFNIVPVDDVIKLVGQMPCKLNSHDPISLDYLKENISCFAEPLHHIVNISLQSGVFPDSLKHGSVSPIVKSPSSDIEVHNDFRPVTTLPFLSKLLEKAAHSQITTYLESQSLIPKYQSAYLKSHSCETALFKFTNDIQQMLSENKAVILVQLDLSAAFDTVDHSVLLNLLECKFGISGLVLQWLTSYLNGRSFSVKIGLVNGRRVLLVYGVPQGSVLGPLLFILYISDLPSIASKHQISLQSYADDSHLYVGFDPASEYKYNGASKNMFFYEIEQWMKSNYLKMNVDKTEVLFIAKPRIHSLFSNMSLILGEEYYFSSANKIVKSLGAFFNGTMTINSMVSELVKACNFNLKKLAAFRYVLPVKQKLLLVKSHVLCKIDYCNILLAKAPANQVNRLQKILHKAMRFVYSLKKRDSVTSSLKEAHILPMNSRIIYKCCVFMFKMLHDQCPHYMSNVIIPKLPQERNLRSNMDDLLFYQTSHHNTLQYAMIQHWNCLPYAVRCISTLDGFKKHLKTYLFNLAYV